ncbi:MAG: hypothetical protein KDD89_14945 [Anaerolineales bacterium]|nr:hypothetical protein [Anaerolineales bacterium]
MPLTATAVLSRERPFCCYLSARLLCAGQVVAHGRVPLIAGENTAVFCCQGKVIWSAIDGRAAVLSLPSPWPLSTQSSFRREVTMSTPHLSTPLTPADTSPATEYAFLQTHQKLTATRQRLKALEFQVEAWRTWAASLEKRVAKLEAELEATRTQLDESEARADSAIEDALYLRDYLNQNTPVYFFTAEEKAHD